MRKAAVNKEINPSTQGYVRALRNKVLYLLIILLVNGTALLAQVGVHTDFPDASSAMDIYSTNKGLLIPRLTLTSSLSDPSPVTSPATGLLIFNNGSNQAIGFYYWDGSQWQQVGSGGSGGNPSWELTGNSGTNISSNFLGTTDNVHFAIRTNNTERMRIESDGQVLVGRTSPYYSSDLFTLNANSAQNYALGIYSSYVGVYARPSYASFYAEDGRYGLVALVDTANGYGTFARNTNSNGHGMMVAGGGGPTLYLTNHIVGVNSNGKDGLFARASHTQGTGILALGNSLDTASLVVGGSGAAVTGQNGLYSKGVNSEGIGVIGVGSNTGSYPLPSLGCGGVFSGYHGIYAKANGAQGTGIVALGYNSATYFSVTSGLGGAFAGYHGITALGNDATTGTGVIGVGNNGSSYYSFPQGSGGAFTGTYCGVYGFATATSGDHYGAYFATDGNASQVGYAYVGGRQGNTRIKIIGVGTVNTIVDNTRGEPVALTCPEAPEIVFQDYGIGQLVEGSAHITIDPDLAINISVSEDHPLKVYITPEGDCNGVYVTNKSANGFDVVELMGGQSNVTFSWQIVATRADEYNVNADGTRELVSDYSRRFMPAPGPAKVIKRGEDDRQILQFGTDVKVPVSQAELPVSAENH